MSDPLDVPSGRPPVPTEPALVAGFLAGDPAAFDEVFRRFVRPLHDYVFGIVRSRTSAEDITQNTFIRAYEQRGSLRDPAAFRSWLYRIAHNVAVNEAERRRPTEQLDADAPLVSETPSAQHLLEQQEAVRLVWDAAAGLEPHQYELLDLSLRQGLSTAEIADLLGMNGQQASLALHRAREALGNAVRYLTVARRRRHCARLAQLIPSGVRVLSAEQRATVDHHMRRCAVCQRTADILTSPAALFASVPFVPLPIGLDHLLARPFAAVHSAHAGLTSRAAAMHQAPVVHAHAGAAKLAGVHISAKALTAVVAAGAAIAVTVAIVATHRRAAAAVPHGISLAACVHETPTGNGTAALETLNPATGSVVARHTYPTRYHDAKLGEVDLLDVCASGSQADPMATNIAGPVADRWSVDIKRGLVAGTSTLQTNGSQHVGWYDVTGGTFTDVTAASARFNPNRRPVDDSQPEFDPVTGEFWFLRTTYGTTEGVLMRADPQTLHVVSTGIHIGDGDGYLVTGGHVVDGLARTYTDGMVPSPDGARVATGSVVTASSGVAVGTVGRAVLNPFNHLALHPFGDITLQCQVLAWMSANTVLVGDPAGSGNCPYASVSLTQHAGALRKLVRDPRFQTADFVVSPDGRQVAFLEVSITRTTVQLASTTRYNWPHQLYQLRRVGGQAEPAELLGWS